ncbi:hypothetical protein CYY_001613 [Polysphondylium violaceum]|uniref:TLDc domain-containing protein n=1 Tax=Polysphondylium violaceum TaxID=133409 RepID=A0A8J4Q1J9_9MYCE|nr:hypothetical protein CYY_001613 [Polysphondylium violaceum]
MDSFLYDDIAKIQRENWEYRRAGCSKREHISLTLELEESKKIIEHLKIDNRNLRENDYKLKILENELIQLRNKYDNLVKINSNLNLVLDSHQLLKGEHSKIIEANLFKVLNDWIKDTKNTFFTLLYRASDNDYNSTTFHNKCDSKGPTITIIKAKSGEIFGGYNSQSWNSDNKMFGDNKCFIFTLVNRHGIQPTKYTTSKGGCVGGYAICGPYFSDIRIYKKESTIQIFPSEFSDTTSKGRSTLTPIDKFILQDYEVYQCLKSL